MKRILLLLTLSVLILFSGFSQSYAFAQKENRHYQKALRASLQRDWVKRRAAKEPEPVVPWSPRSASSSKPWASSACYKNKTEPFENFQIEQPLLSMIGNVSTEAFYCAAENQYWIDECSGSPASSCRTAGAFDFNPENDPLFKAQIAGN